MLLIDDSETGGASADKSATDSVIAVTRHQSLAELVDMVLGGATNPNPAPANGANDLPAQGPKQVQAVTRAFNYLEKVVEMVKQNKLPGPIVPGMLEEALKIFGDPDVSFGEVATFARKHQTISARLLSVSNSAYYARLGGRVTSLESAISRIGLNGTRDLVQAVAARGYVVGRDKLLQAKILAKLKAAYLIALLCAELARIVRHGRAGRIQLVGLFHNIGQVFLVYSLALLKDKGLKVDLDPESLEVAIANRAVELNRLMCKQANLPLEAVGVYSSADLVGQPEREEVVGFVHQAMWFADRCVSGGVPAVLTVDAEGELLGLSQRIVDAVKVQIPNVLGAVKAYAEA
jgi:hypothetical protein